MPPDRKVVLKRRRRPGREALLTFADLFTVIRIEQMLAERSPANEVGRVVRASGSPPARQRGYGHRGRICVTRPALVLAGRSGWGAFASSTQLTGASNNPCGWGPSPPPQCTTPGPCGCRGLARAGTKSALPGNDPTEWPERPPGCRRSRRENPAPFAAPRARLPRVLTGQATWPGRSVRLRRGS